jgi:hypothetical protein
MLTAPTRARVTGFQIAECLTTLLHKNASPFMNSVYVISFAGLRGFDDICIGLTVTLLTKYPRIISINLGDVAHVSADGWDSFVQALLAPDCGVVAGFVECQHRGETDDLSLQVKDAMTQQRKRMEAQALALLAASAGKCERERLSAVRDATALVPWRSEHVWVRGRKRLGVWACMRACPFAAGDENVWWGFPFWRPKQPWKAQCVE